MKKSAYLVEEGWLNRLYKRPIYVLEITKSKFFPVRFRYKGKGYTNLIFTEKLNQVEFIK